MFEATATWVEEHVYPEVNDYVLYVRGFASTPGAPLTSTRAAGGLKFYGAAVWNHWLDASRGYGPLLIRDAWEISELTDPHDFALGAYHQVITGAGGRGFAREFARFSAATAEWRTGNAGFPDAASYADVRRRGRLGKGGPGARFELDHTAYRLLDVTGPGKRLRLRARVEPGVRAGIALVGRDGDALTGAVTTVQTFLPAGGRRSVVLEDPGRFERITAVVTNADPRIKGRGLLDWHYGKDDSEFRARITG